MKKVNISTDDQIDEIVSWLGEKNRYEDEKIFIKGYLGYYEVIVKLHNGQKESVFFSCPSFFLLTKDKDKSYIHKGNWQKYLRDLYAKALKEKERRRKENESCSANTDSVFAIL